MESNLKVSLTIIKISAVNPKERDYRENRDSSITKFDKLKNDKEHGKFVSPKKSGLFKISAEKNNKNSVKERNINDNEALTSLTSKKNIVKNNLLNDEFSKENNIVRKNSLRKQSNSNNSMSKVSKIPENSHDSKSNSIKEKHTKSNK